MAFVGVSVGLWWRLVKVYGCFGWFVVEVGEEHVAGGKEHDEHRLKLRFLQLQVAFRSKHLRREFLCAHANCNVTLFHFSSAVDILAISVIAASLTPGTSLVKHHLCRAFPITTSLFQISLEPLFSFVRTEAPPPSDCFALPLYLFF